MASAPTIPPELLQLAFIVIFTGAVAMFSSMILDHLAYRKQTRAQEHVMHVIEMGVQGVLGINTITTVDEATERRQLAGLAVKREVAKAQ